MTHEFIITSRMTSFYCTLQDKLQERRYRVSKSIVLVFASCILTPYNLFMVK